MSSLRVESVVTDSFGIEPALRDDTLSVKLTGTGDMAAAAPLGCAGRPSAAMAGAARDVTAAAARPFRIDRRSDDIVSFRCISAPTMRGQGSSDP